MIVLGLVDGVFPAGAKYVMRDVAMTITNIPTVRTPTIGEIPLLEDSKRPPNGAYRPPLQFPFLTLPITSPSGRMSKNALRRY